MDREEKIRHLQMLENAEGQQALMAINAIISTKHGKDFLKYLLKSLDVGEFPEVGTENSILLDRIGFLRAGQSVFKMIAEANPEIAGQLIGLIEKERYEAKLLFENET